MKTQKKKTFNLNKLQVAKLDQTNFIKGMSIGHLKSLEFQGTCKSGIIAC